MKQEIISIPIPVLIFFLGILAGVVGFIIRYFLNKIDKIVKNVQDRIDEIMKGIQNITVETAVRNEKLDTIKAEVQDLKKDNEKINKRLGHVELQMGQLIVARR